MRGEWDRRVGDSFMKNQKGELWRVVKKMELRGSQVEEQISEDNRQ